MSNFDNTIMQGPPNPFAMQPQQQQQGGFMQAMMAMIPQLLEGAITLQDRSKMNGLQRQAQERRDNQGLAGFMNLNPQLYTKDAEGNTVPKYTRESMGYTTPENKGGFFAGTPADYTAMLSPDAPTPQRSAIPNTSNWGEQARADVNKYAELSKAHAEQMAAINELSKTFQGLPDLVAGTRAPADAQILTPPQPGVYNPTDTGARLVEGQKHLFGLQGLVSGTNWPIGQTGTKPPQMRPHVPKGSFVKKPVKRTRGAK